MIKKNSIYTVKTNEINTLGYGVAKIDGMVVFVAQAAPGDELEIKIIKVTKNYAVARIERIISPSAYRIEPTCPISGPCGGCVYAHISYESEAASKTEAVKNELRKAGLPDITVHPLLSPSEVEAYRNKAQMPFTSVNGTVKTGYFAAKTHRVICPENGCALLPDDFNSIAKKVCDIATREKISVYDEITGRGILRHLYMRRGAVSEEVLVCFVVNEHLDHIKVFVDELTSVFPQIRSIVINYNSKNTNVILGDRTEIVFGDGMISDTLCQNVYEISPHSFYQINHTTAEAIYKKAIELADLKETDRIADLYCGIGTIGLSAARSCKISELIGVEIIEDAVKNARRNAAKNGIKNARFYCGDANDPHIDGCNVIFVDPPRKGLSQALIDRLSAISAEKIVYISCAPDTLARDLKALTERGYKAVEVFPYDMFPRTAHVETVVLMSKEA